MNYAKVHIQLSLEQIWDEGKEEEKIVLHQVKTSFLLWKYAFVIVDFTLLWSSITGVGRKDMTLPPDPTAGADMPAVKIWIKFVYPEECYLVECFPCSSAIFHSTYQLNILPETKENILFTQILLF